MTLRASAITDGDATARRTGLSFGGDFGMIKGNSTVTPDVAAMIDSSAANPTVVKAGAVDIEATHGSPVAMSDGTLASIDTNADLLTTSAPHGLKTGDRITYTTNGNPAIGGLVADRSYGVIVLNDTVVKLGNPFVAENVNDAFDTIRFSTQHGLQTGDLLEYGHKFGDGASAIGGLLNGVKYYVRVIDSLTVKLGTSLAQVTQGLKSFQVSAVDAASNVVTLANHGFSNNQAVTYRAPRTASFNGYAVDDAAEKIAIGPAPNGNDFQTGDRVTYTVSGVDGRAAVAIGGPSNGGSYYVYRVDAETVKLSTAAIKNDGTDVFVNLTRSSGADQSLHKLTRFGEKPLPAWKTAAPITSKP